MKEKIKNKLEELFNEKKITFKEKNIEKNLFEKVYEKLKSEFESNILDYEIILNENLFYEIWKLYFIKEKNINCYIEVKISKIISSFILDGKAEIIDENPESIVKNLEGTFGDMTYKSKLDFFPKLEKVLEEYNYTNLEYIDVYFTALEIKNKNFFIRDFKNNFTLNGLFFIDKLDVFETFLIEKYKQS
ncbi:hypothetical protein [Fusobacterium ulcerans]|uniref:hypothetical protein n=1 Tax=Fusobacterium ulcerans TaxID=861 RepID=UPI002420321D|nr:hypothetical protein [Fusobacterium ulcerans]